MIPELPSVVTSARLRLPLITPADAEDFRAGRRHPTWHPDYPRRDDVDAASLIKPADSATMSWGPRHVVRAVDGLVCGSIGFFGVPVGEPPETEVGFGLVADARGHGAATEALTALTQVCDAAGVRLRASVDPDNRASLRVLAKCGFTQLRGTTEEGTLIMVRTVRTPQET